MMTVVLWPRKRRLGKQQAGRVLLIAGGAAGVVAVLLALLVPAAAPVTGPQALPATALATATVGGGDTVDVPLTGTTTVTVVALIRTHADACTSTPG